ncbi:potassium channel family protein [Methanobrevibacter boviskoreani]|uniref:potassium channel family protein n=1 Tax=Methanobrevibacter boviskoreani TaxID=1348249 RepID=UPI0023A7F3EE|nr:TrkA family potassium uptake protein [Methanobrevibacter boviskoreani]MCI6775513.1 TrkA family potassium uptake protein [Methanobrevibacter boviskoreani]MCI6930410.1 TrkA family potassium uptake protein [Methanobrevibacter boviskoreani]MDY5614987.1 TrkA family potassium uptake protein [Methanobrevibacter boviskoreani]
MYAVIMGGGRVGLSLASLLIEDGYDITLIENNEVLSNNASVELDALVICGSGTDTKILEEANIQDADFFVATTGNDETNLLSCILVREYGIPKIIARVSNTDHEEAFKKVGIDEVINPERTAAGYLEKIITRPNVADLTAFGQGDAEILDMIITNNKIIGKQIYEVSPDDDYIIIATYENGRLEIPKQDDILTKGKKISILVKRDALKKTEKKFE